MKLDDRAEEVLESLWLGTQEGEATAMSLAELAVDGVEEVILQLLQAGYVSRDDDHISLTERGRPEAARVVRRHRLAERLLTDVLEAGDALLDERACKFEHLLDQGLDDSICTLLGHPKLCPHGKPIPPGLCCRGQERLRRLVSPLSGLEAGQAGEIAYIYAPRTENLQRLMSLGILPGQPVTLVQSFPSWVFWVGHTQFAVDKEVADAIYVRLQDTTPDRPAERGLGRRFRWRLRLGRGART